jgi:hypothetical protein
MCTQLGSACELHCTFRVAHSTHWPTFVLTGPGSSSTRAQADKPNYGFAPLLDELHCTFYICRQWAQSQNIVKMSRSSRGRWTSALNRRLRQRERGPLSTLGNGPVTFVLFVLWLLGDIAWGAKKVRIAFALPQCVLYLCVAPKENKFIYIYIFAMWIDHADPAKKVSYNITRA